MSETRPQGFCKDCRVEPVTDTSRCPGCAKKRNDAAKAARQIAASKGLCAWEGGNCKRKAVKGKRYCKEHLAYHADRRKAAE